MKTLNFRETLFPLAMLLLFAGLSCSKDEESGPSDPCASFNATITATATNTNACVNNGSITVTANGGSNLTYSIDGSSFQASNVFNNVAKGNYTVTVKNASNCTKTTSVTVTENNATPGPLFTAVKQVIQANCVSCHQPGGQQPNPDWTKDCNIVANAANIHTRAVENGTMPPTGPLAQADKDKISAWFNAGGKITD